MSQVRLEKLLVLAVMLAAQVVHAQQSGKLSRHRGSTLFDALRHTLQYVSKRTWRGVLAGDQPIRSPRSKVICAKRSRYSAGVMPVWRLKMLRKKAASS